MKRFVSVCITGVDGTGKSTTVKRLSDYFGNEKSEIQYMGSKNWETRLAEKYLSKPGKMYSLTEKIYGKWILIFEMYKRVYKHAGSDKLIIFDRYVDEQALWYRTEKATFKGKLVQLLYTVIFTKCFYRPTITFYLMCDVSVSVKRKDDIAGLSGIDDLRRIKNVFDDYYIPLKDVIKIDTSSTGIEDTVDIILKHMEEKRCFSTFLK